MTIPWPIEAEKRAPGLRNKVRRWWHNWVADHMLNVGIFTMMVGLIGLIVGTANGSRPSWPAPVVFIIMSIVSIGACVLALIVQEREPRIGAIVFVFMTGSVRGVSFALDIDNDGLHVAGAVGAYAISGGLAIFLLSVMAGVPVSGKRRAWDG